MKNEIKGSRKKRGYYSKWRKYGFYMVMFIPFWEFKISRSMARIMDLEYRTMDTESSAEATKGLLEFELTETLGVSTITLEELL